MNWGRRSILAVAVAIVGAVAGCSAERIESAIDAPLPDYVKPCEDQYEEGKIIEYGSDGDFSRACRSRTDELITPVPARLDCTDGPDLLYNDFAWGYDGREMALFADDDTVRRPSDDERMACLRRDIESDADEDGDD